MQQLSKHKPQNISNHMGLHMNVMMAHYSKRQWGPSTNYLKSQDDLFDTPKKPRLES
jgi:hypothetical protein